MPTGYTAKLVDEGQEFPDFVMTCARAFGALIELRDEPLDAEIPESFEPSSYNDRRIEEAQQALAEATTLSDADIELLADADHRRAVARYTEVVARAVTVGARVRAMIAQVEAWTPPTDEHQGLRDFMLQQLNETLKFDASTSYLNEPVKLSVEEYRAAAIARANRDITYHREQAAAEAERAAARTEWVKVLRESLAVSA